MRACSNCYELAIFYPPSGSPLCAPGAAGPSGQARVAPSGPMSMPGKMEFLEALYLGKECEPIQGSRVIHVLFAVDASATDQYFDDFFTSVSLPQVSSCKKGEMMECVELQSSQPTDQGFRKAIKGICIYVKIYR